MRKIPGKEIFFAILKNCSSITSRTSQNHLVITSM